MRRISGSTMGFEANLASEAIPDCRVVRRRSLWQVCTVGIDILEDIVQRLVEAAHPQKIVLFGSYARGTQTADSDVDLLVLEQSVDSKYREVLRLRKALRGILHPIDVVVVSTDEFAEKSKIASTLCYWADREGKVLYDAAR